LKRIIHSQICQVAIMSCANNRALQYSANTNNSSCFESSHCINCYRKNTGDVNFTAFFR